MRATGPTRSLLLPVAVALACRLILVAAAWPDPARFLLGDSEGYIALGETFPGSLRATTGEIGSLSLARTPIYPAFLALVFAAGGGIRAAAVVQIGFALSIVVLVHRLGTRLVDERAGTWAAILVAIEPISIQLTPLILTETLFVLCVVAAIAAQAIALRSAPIAGAASTGLLLGLAALVRPIALFAPVVVLPVLWLRAKGALSRRLTMVFAALVPFLLVVGAWIGWNQHRTGEATFSTIASVNMALYRGAGAIAEEDGVSMQTARGRIHEEAAARGVDGMGPVEAARLYSYLGVEALADHPRGAAISAIKGLVRTLFGPGTAGFEHLIARSRAEAPVVIGFTTIASIVVMLLFYAAAGLGAVVSWRRWPDLFWLTVPLAIYFLMISAGAEAYSRFRAPAVPPLALVAGAGLVALRDRRPTSRQVPNPEIAGVKESR